jgi:alkyl hydroperoxide reductase subunit F
MYELAIIGGGPAGVAAGVYASRKKIKTVFITKDFLSQSSVSDSIENWIGTISIPGTELAKSLENHLRAYAGDIVDIKTGIYAKNISKVDSGFEIEFHTGEKVQAKTILIATGSHRRKLVATGADAFEHKGLTYCATCDGPIFAGKDVAVIGGGNAGFESAAQLLAYANSVTLLHKNADFKADQITVESVLKNPKMKTLTGVSILEVTGDKFVNGLKYKNNLTGEESTLDVQGIFIEIGAVPTTEYAKGVVTLDDYNRVVIDPWNHRTSELGIWAAGDCTNGLYHQNNIAAGDAVKALEDIYIYLQQNK